MSASLSKLSGKARGFLNKHVVDDAGGTGAPSGAPTGPTESDWKAKSATLKQLETDIGKLEGWKTTDAPGLRSQLNTLKGEAKAKTYGSAITHLDQAATAAAAAVIAASAPLTLTHQTDCSTLTRTRLKLGVGEKVDVTVDRGPAKWVVGNKTLKVSTTTVTVTAEKAGALKVAVTVGGATADVTFTVVEPTGLTMDQSGATRHTNNTASSGFWGQPWVTPADVSFHAIQIREKNSGATASGAYRQWNKMTHQPKEQSASGWFTVEESTSGKGSEVNCEDSVHSGELTGPPFAPGQLTFPCDWEYKTAKTSAKVFAKLTHLQVIDAAGKVTVSKGGTTVSSNYADGTSG